MKLFLFFFWITLLGVGANVPQVIQVPPTLTSAGTSTTVNGQTWGYIVWNTNVDGWLDGKKLSVHLQAGPDANFQLQGTMQLLTDPEAIQPWIVRAGLLGEDLDESSEVAEQLFNFWKEGEEVFPAALEEQLSALTNRVAQDPPSGDALRQIGQSRPLFRFISGTGWAGPLGVATGTEVVIEVRDETEKVVGRIELVAGESVTLERPGPPVQVLPDFPQEFPEPAEETFAPPALSTQIDRSISLRWAVPEALRKQILLTRGFYLWRLPEGYAGPLTGEALENDPSVRRLTESPAIASTVYRISGSGESGPDVDDFESDRETWFVVDDNDRYATAGDATTVIGTAYEEGETWNYVVAAVDLLGRIGPVSERGTGVAAYQVPPQVPDVLRVENFMDGTTQRLKVVWKPNENRSEDVPATHYLVYRDRLANDPMPDNALDKSTHIEGRKDLIYLGMVEHDSEAATLEFLDQSLTPQPQDFNHPYFYCIRAAHLGPLGFDISRPSPAVFGTLRDRRGTEAPGGYVKTECPRVGICLMPNSPRVIDTKPLGPGKAVMRFNVYRGLEDGRFNDVSWVLVGASRPGEGDIRPGGPQDPEVLAISPALFFGRGDFLSFDIPVEVTPNEPRIFSILGVSSAGSVSHICSQTIDNIRPGVVAEADFRVIAGPILSMAPEATSALPERYLCWEKYFDLVEIFVPRPAGPGTLCGIVVGARERERSRHVLIQSRAANGREWENCYSAVIPPGEDRFYFPRPEELENIRWRYWILDESPFTPDPANCPHEGRHPGDEGVTGIGVIVILPEGSAEYRIYRRVNDGKLSLLAQEADRWNEEEVQAVIHEDGFMPPAGGRVAYYGQTFDRHGNPSPLKLLSTRVSVLGELPKPVLEEIKAGGDEENPTMLLKAVVPSPGVARLEFVISPRLDEIPEGLLASPKLPSLQFTSGSGSSEPQGFSATYAGPTILDRDPSDPVILEVEIPVELDREYTVTAHCVGLGGKIGAKKSETRQMTWASPPPLNMVPWPERSLPSVISWDGRICAFEVEEDNLQMVSTGSISTPPTAYPVAIRIGRIPFTESTPNRFNNFNVANPNSNWSIWGVVDAPNGESPTISGVLGVSDAVGLLFGNNIDPDNQRADLFEQYLYKKKIPNPELVIEDPDSSLFPFVLYRQQVARKIEGVDEPTPDTDIVQASHLVRSIAWDTRSLPRPPGEENPPPPNFAFITDPWIGPARKTPLPTGGFHADLCYFDTTPVMAGATYQYYLLHFDELGEPDGIIDAGQVTISE